MRHPISAFALIAVSAFAANAGAQSDPSWTPADGPGFDVLVAASPTGSGASGAVAEQPNSDPDLPPWLELGAEYRMRMQYFNPLDLSGTDVRSTDWTEHRARLSLGLVHGDWMAIRTRIDVLDQVLWGDNGRVGTNVEPNSGVSVATNEPNLTGVTVGLPQGDDPLDPDSYVPVLRSAEPLQVDLLYIDVNLPIGLLRVGRQPGLGQGLVGHNGERGNRWGVATYRDAGDRIFFATKLDEAFRMLTSSGDYEVNTSQESGLFWGSWYEIMDQGNLGVAGDNLRQIATSLNYRVPEFRLGNVQGHDMSLSLALVNVGGDDFQTNVFAIPLIAEMGLGNVDLSLSASFLRGETIEISEGFATLTRVDAELQDVRAEGARAVIDWHVGPAMLTMEVDYASGDGDPRSNTPITSFGMPRDLNIGLLLFEQILAYESARSAAVGFENLRNLDSVSFPLTEVATDGRFTNAFAIFPQVLMNWVDTPENRFHTRVGLMLAWPDEGVVDPIATVLAFDGVEISDDAVNFHDGDPGNYYGTEVDLQLGWTFRERFLWTVEGAVLFPGNSLEDENGDAINAFMLENRFELLF